MSKQILVCQNIKGTPKMRFRSVRHDLHRVKQTGCTVAGFQEMKWPWYWTALALVFPRATGRGWGKYRAVFMGARSSQPVIWRRKVWKVTDRRQELLHEGRAKVSETRYLTAVLLIERETGMGVWVKNTHYLPAAWKTPEVPPQPYRRERWNEGNRHDRSMLNELLTTGYPVISIGDYNRLGPVLGPDEEYVTKVGIDHVVVSRPTPVRAKNDLRILDVSQIPESDLFTDHAGRVVKFVLTAVPR